MLTKERKEELARGFEAGKLLMLYDSYRDRLNPSNEDDCEWFNVLMDEVIRRLNEGSEK